MKNNLSTIKNVFISLKTKYDNKIVAASNDTTFMSVITSKEESANSYRKYMLTSNGSSLREYYINSWGAYSKAVFYAGPAEV